MVYFQQSVGPRVGAVRVHTAEIAVDFGILLEEHFPDDTVALYGDVSSPYAAPFLDGVVKTSFSDRIQYGVGIIGLDVGVCHYALEERCPPIDFLATIRKWLSQDRRKTIEQFGRVRRYEGHRYIAMGRGEVRELSKDLYALSCLTYAICALAES